MNRGVFGLNNYDVRPLAGVYLSASQTISSATVTQINYDVVEFDPYSLWDAVNRRFKIPSTGVWRVNNTVQGNGSTAITNVQALLYRNGSSIRQMGLIGGNSQSQACGTCFVSLRAGDLIDGRGFVTGTGTITIVGDPSGASTYFQIEFVRPL